MTDQTVTHCSYYTVAALTGQSETTQRRNLICGISYFNFTREKPSWINSPQQSECQSVWNLQKVFPQKQLLENDGGDGAYTEVFYTLTS